MRYFTYSDKPGTALIRLDLEGDVAEQLGSAGWFAAPALIGILLGGDDDLRWDEISAEAAQAIADQLSPVKVAV